MSARRGLATSGAPAARPSSDHSAALDRLAKGWAAQVAPSSTRTVVARRLASVLRMLAVVLRAEPFSAAAARDLGATLLVTGLCADLAEPAACGDALAASLALLRTAETPGALGVPGGDARLSAALDELAAGFAAAMAVGAHRLRDAGSVREQLARLPGASLTEDWLARAFAGGITRVGICALTLDGFGAIVDAYGTAVGDRLLLAFAGRLSCATGDHLATRTGSDEFTVLVADPEDADAVRRIADRLQSVLAMPFPIDGHDIVVSASIGVAEGPTAHQCPKEILRAADVARSWAKASGGGRRVVFDPRRDAGEAARYALVSRMPGGIANGEFRLLYQPLVTLPDGRVRGAEALVRWQHPHEGLIGPGRFIELAEQSGAIVALGGWVLRTACEQAAAWWRELGEDAPFVSVNVSPVQLEEPSWVDEVIAALRVTGLPPRQLQLEITEQAVLGDGTAVTEGLSALRGAGVRLALDDFGTGWSSLAWLRRLPVDALKIDGSFVDGLRHAEVDTVDAAIVGALVGMAHALGIEVTAEWVETGVQADRLSALACDLGQGRWFGDAGPGEWVPSLARRRMKSDPLAQ